MNKSELTLHHELDCLRNELDRMTDQENRIHKNKGLVLEQILRTRRELLLLERANGG